MAGGETLLDVLRDTLGLTGTKKGCNLGDCGACTVLVDGEPMNSCLVLASEMEGKEITTIEGVAQQWRAGAHPEGVRPRGGDPVRLLHARDDHVFDRALEQEPAAQRRGNQRRPGRQSVPLHRLLRHYSRRATVRELPRRRHLRQSGSRCRGRSLHQRKGFDSAPGRGRQSDRTGALHRRHFAAAHGPRQDSGLADRPRSDQADRHRESRWPCPAF